MISYLKPEPWCNSFSLGMLAMACPNTYAILAIANFQDQSFSAPFNIYLDHMTSFRLFINICFSPTLIFLLVARDDGYDPMELESIKNGVVSYFGTETMLADWICGVKGGANTSYYKKRLLQQINLRKEDCRYCYFINFG